MPISAPWNFFVAGNWCVGDAFELEGSAAVWGSLAAKSRMAGDHSLVMESFSVARRLWPVARLTIDM